MASANSLAYWLSSPMGEYFFTTISPSRPVKISMGSPSRIRSVRRISLGTTTLPRSSILLTIPVAFMFCSSVLQYFHYLHVLDKCSICRMEEFIPEGIILLHYLHHVDAKKPARIYRSMIFSI